MNVVNIVNVFHRAFSRGPNSQPWLGVPSPEAALSFRTVSLGPLNRWYCLCNPSVACCAGLARLCAPIFTARNLQTGFVSLIAVEAPTVEGTLVEALPDLRKLIERCILPSQDVLLPSLGDAPSARVAFVVACTDQSGAEVIARRIREKIQDAGHPSNLQLDILVVTLDVPAPDNGQPAEGQIGKVAGQIEQLVQAHLERRSVLK